MNDNEWRFMVLAERLFADIGHVIPGKLLMDGQCTDSDSADTRDGWIPEIVANARR